jgi:proteasome accessory factor B
MSQRKSERLLNLAIALMNARRFLLRSELRSMISDYQEATDEAFGRMFERDKAELREAGLPIEVRSNSVLFDDEPGYRIIRSDVELPPVEFTPEEWGALSVAASVWQQAQVSDQASRALTKLRATTSALPANPEVTSDAALMPFVGAREPAFEPLWNATVRHIPVSFVYRSGSEPRTVEPWRMTYRKAAWYLLAFDRTREEPRTFKVGRIVSEVLFAGEPDSYRMPNDVDLAAYAQSLEPSGKPDEVALLGLRDGRAVTLRRRGSAETDAANERVPQGFSLVRVPYASNSGFVAQVAREGEDVIVLEPAELVRQVGLHWRGLIENLEPAHALGVDSLEARPLEVLPLDDKGV